LAYWNYVRKSTEGFSIQAFMLDMTGGTLSLVQEFIDLADGKTTTLNPAKTGLGIVTIFYDSVLLYQHYVLYGDKTKKSKSDSFATSISNSEGDEYTKFKDNMEL